MTWRFRVRVRALPWAFFWILHIKTLSFSRVRAREKEYNFCDFFHPSVDEKKKRKKNKKLIKKKIF